MTRYLPKRTSTGNHTGLVVAGEELTSRGVIDGVVVRSNACLVLQGVLSGEVTIEEDGIPYVYGVLSTSSITNNGLILFAGVTSIPLEGFSALGRIVVAPGALVDGNLQVLADGSTRRLVGGENVDFHVQADTWSFWDGGRFVP